MKLHWSDIAEADLDDIHDHIARDVPYYAELFVDRLIEATDKLEDHPRIGRRVPEADDRDDRCPFYCCRDRHSRGRRLIYR